VFGERTSVGLDVHARSVVAAAIDGQTGVGPSAANASIVRDTVGSEATGPNTRGSARSTATSARQSPPSARVSARSVITLPGSCRAIGLHHGASAIDSPRPRPAARAASTSTTAPLCDTTPDPFESTWTRGYNPILFTLKVLLAQRILA
jgi:hypothetical protein